ncbi:MAG: hypothetical protein AAF907_12830, partial [Planctomycetota bacterium]
SAAALIETAGGTAAIRGGSVTRLGDAPAVAVRAVGGTKDARVLLEGTTLRGDRLTAVSLAGPGSELFARNCLLACGDGPAVAFPPVAEGGDAATDGAASPNRPAPRPGGGRINFIAHRQPLVRPAPRAAGRSAQLVACTGVFRRSAVVVVPGAAGELAVTLADCAFGAAPGVERATLSSGTDDGIDWLIEGGVLAGLSAPAGVEANGRSSGWAGDPPPSFAALDPTALNPVDLSADAVPPPPWRPPSPVSGALAEAGARLPADPLPWEERFPDGNVVTAEANRIDDELERSHPDGTTIVVVGGGRTRLKPISVAGRSLRIVGRADESGATPLLAASAGAGGVPLFQAVGGRLELVNLTLESRPDRTGAGPLVAAEGAESQLVIARCELRAGAGDAAAVRVRNAEAHLTGVLLVGDAAEGLVEVDRGGVSLRECGVVASGPAISFGPDGTGTVRLTRCAISAAGPIFNAKPGGDAVALTDRCLFLPPPPGVASRVPLSAG